MDNRFTRLLESIAKTLAVLSGFYVIVLCLQPKDGGENGGIGGIGGYSAIITAIFVITVAYVIYRQVVTIGDLKTQVDSMRHRLKN
jgi:preprotein translocase subunit SecY